MACDAFAVAALRGSAFVLPTAANLDPETAVFAVWRVAGLAADLAVLLIAITLPQVEFIRNSRNVVAGRWWQLCRIPTSGMLFTPMS